MTKRLYGLFKNGKLLGVFMSDLYNDAVNWDKVPRDRFIFTIGQSLKDADFIPKSLGWQKPEKHNKRKLIRIK